MQKITLLCAMAAMSLCSATAQWQRTPTPNDTLRSTIVNGDKVTFQIYAPQAQTVMVTGDLPWDKPAKFVKDASGVWSATIDGLANGVFRYRFVVDGVSVNDPKSPYANETQALLDTSDPSAPWAVKNVPHGAIAQRYYYSSVLKETQRMHVWTPAGYEKSGKDLPVLYLVHGGGDNDASWPTVGAACNILDNLLAEGKMQPMIVVMPNGSISTTSMEGEVPIFAEEMVKDIVPFVEANYRVKTGKQNRAMAGLSMGGWETLEVLITTPELCETYWVLSSGWFPDRKEMFEGYAKRLHDMAPAIKKNVKQLAFTQGGPTDIAYKNCLGMLPLFDKEGIQYEKYLEGFGGHSWTAWRNDLVRLAPRLFK